jgi:RNA polymerase sigma-70 factor (ECF subfamily)
LEDLDLLELWRGGDKDAVRQLLDRYFPLLYRFFVNKVSGEVDDLVQQTMMALVPARDSFEGRSTFRAYLLSIARFQLYEYVRRRKRSNEVIEYDSVTAFDVSPSPSVLVAEHRDRQVLLEALRRIPLNFQLALELHYWEDLSGPELAEALGIPVDTAYSRVRKARELVKEQIRLLVGVTPANSSETKVSDSIHCIQKA